jgi:hypothetical protein
MNLTLNCSTQSNSDPTSMGWLSDVPNENPAIIWGAGKNVVIHRAHWQAIYCIFMSKHIQGLTAKKQSKRGTQAHSAESRPSCTWCAVTFIPRRKVIYPSSEEYFLKGQYSTSEIYTHIYPHTILKVVFCRFHNFHIKWAYLKVTRQVHTYNPSPWETEAEGFWIWAQPGIHS